jgi:hypothetical protein
MVELSVKKRDSLPRSRFGLGEGKKYPMPDKSRARHAQVSASRLPVDLRLLARRDRPRLLDLVLDK